MTSFFWSGIMRQKVDEMVVRLTSSPCIFLAIISKIMSVSYIHLIRCPFFDFVLNWKMKARVQCGCFQCVMPAALLCKWRKKNKPKSFLHDIVANFWVRCLDSNWMIQIGKLLGIHFWVVFVVPPIECKIGNWKKKSLLVVETESGEKQIKFFKFFALQWVCQLTTGAME